LGWGGWAGQVGRWAGWGVLIKTFKASATALTAFIFFLQSHQLNKRVSGNKIANGIPGKPLHDTTSRI
jgi:hypothetical protein